MLRKRQIFYLDTDAAGMYRVYEGRIAQHGTHDQLVKQEGLYRRFTAIRQQAEGWRIAAE